MTRNAIDKSFRDLMGALISDKIRIWKENAPDGEIRTNDMLAEKLGVTRGSIQKWCSGESVPRSEMKAALCSVLGISEDELKIDNATHDQKYKNSSFFITEIGRNDIQFANEIGLDINLIRALSSIVDFNEHFPIYAPIEQTGNMIEGYKLSRMRNADSKEIDKDLYFLQIKRNNQTFTFSECDMAYLKEVQDHIIRYVKYLFYERYGEMEDEVNSLYNEMYHKLDNGGLAYTPLTFETVCKHDRFAKYSMKPVKDPKEGK